MLSQCLKCVNIFKRKEIKLYMFEEELKVSEKKTLDFDDEQSKHYFSRLDNLCHTF